MYELWLQMEEFYFSRLWLIIIVCAILGIIMFPSLSYLKQSWAKIVVVISLVTWLISGYYAINQYSKYSDMIDRVVLANPATRKYEKKLFNDFYYSQSDYSFYRQSYLPQSFEAVGLYDKNEIKQPVIYKGTDGSYYYIEFNGEIYYTSSKYIQTTSDSKSQRLGINYQLSDTQFTEIGFIEQSNNFFTHYEIPEKIIENKVSNFDKERAIYQAKKLIGGWLIP